MDIDYTNVKFVLCKPYKERYYTYCINDINSMTVIPKDDLRKIISTLSNQQYSNDLDYLFSHNFPFIWDNKEKKLRRFSLISKDLTKNDISNIFAKEMKFTNKSNSFQADVYKKFFN